MRRSLKRGSWVLSGAFLFALISSPISAQDRGAVTAAEARKIIADGNRDWGRARVALDKTTFEKMLASDFYVQLPGRRLTRQEFIDGISAERPGAKLTRFDATVLTVQRTADGWVAVIHEKLEIEGPDGSKGYSLWITRDGWKQEDGRWLITFSEAIGFENWVGGAKPPFPYWGPAPGH